MINVVHITPHMSGGLASVLLSTLKYADRFTPEVSHEIITLDDISDKIRKIFINYEKKLHIKKNHTYIDSKIKEADIVQIEYWNHPLIYKFLAQFQFPPSRILSCCHVSGLFRPQIITKNMVNFADIFLALTTATNRHELFKNTYANSFIDKLRFVRFPVDVERFSVNRVRDNHYFNVGYIGTVSYSKLHRSFLSMCAKVKINDVKFIICGEDNTDNIELESKHYNPNIYDFRGFQDDISLIYEMIDVFAYPLNSNHFGSGEQAIIEAMYFGIPIVAFSNPAETAIIENNVTGILVETEEQYVNAIEYLYKNPRERVRLGQNAKNFVENQLNPKKCFESLDNIYRELIVKPKTIKQYGSYEADKRIDKSDEFGAKLFIESLGGKGTEFLDSMVKIDDAGVKDADTKIANIEISMKTKTKGSLYQYLYFFPDDPYLNFWVGLVKQKEDKHKEAAEHFKKSLKYISDIGRVNKHLNKSLSKI